MNTNEECTSDIVNTTNEGYLYSCSDETTCSELSGKGYYYKDANEVYFCNGALGKCKKVTTPLGSTCDGSNIGKLYDPAAVKICLNYVQDTAVDHAISADTTNIVIPHYTNSIFGTTANTQYAFLVATKDTSILLKSDAGKLQNIIS